MNISIYEKPVFLKILSGHTLIIISGILYSVFWVLDYYNQINRPDILSGFLVLLSLISGISGAVLLINSVSGFSVQITANFRLFHLTIITVVCFILSLIITVKFFHRQFTSEIIFIFIWAGIEISCIFVLYKLNSFSIPQFIISIILFFICLLVSMFCYIIHYSLTGKERFINGLIPYVAVSSYMLMNVIILLYNRFFIKSV
jgi:hypothetical protein